MSRETFMSAPVEPLEEAVLEPVDNRPEHEVPAEVRRADAEREYAELESRISSLQETMAEYQRNSFPVPAAVTDRYGKLVARKTKLGQQLGFGKQLGIEFPGENQGSTSRAA